MIPGHAVRLCTTRLSDTVTATTWMISDSCSMLPRSTTSRPSTNVPMPRGPNQPMNTRSRSGTSLRSSASHTATRRTAEQRDDGEHHDAPTDVAPTHDHRIAAEHREDRQLE